jgi:hypothetical protein
LPSYCLHACLSATTSLKKNLELSSFQLQDS